MRFQEYIAHCLIGTPMEKLALKLRDTTKIWHQYKHPELKAIYLESGRAEKAMQRIIQPAMNCIDIGCHLGSVLSLMRRLAPQGQHIAIEPIPYKADWLRRKFPQVTIHQVALSDTEGTADFYLQRQQSGFSGLRMRGAAESDAVELLKVQCAKLDKLVAADTPIGFIKIDVEGAELAALRGGEALLNRHHPVVLFECAKRALEANEVAAYEVYEFFQSHAYDIFLIQDWLEGTPPLAYEPFSQAMEYPFQAFNFLAVPRNS